MGGQAKFTTVWTKKDESWIISDLLSYDHGEPRNLKMTDPHEQLLKDNSVPALGLGIIENGKLTQIKVYGTLDGKTTATYNSLFNVASLTQPITAMTVLSLVSAGKWNLDEPLDKCWIDPDIARDPRHKKLTTRIILSHQTGFPNWRWQKTNRQLSFEFDPGSGYQYSGEGFEYLRKAIENKFHKSLEVLAEEMIFQPLGMTDTSYIWNEKKDGERIVTEYSPNRTPYQTVKNTKVNAADDLITSLEDYSRFVIAVMNNDLLSQAVFEEMKTRQVETKKNKYFGLGFEIYDLKNGETALSHGGSDKGVNAIALMLPKTKQGLVIFTNVDDGIKSTNHSLISILAQQGGKLSKLKPDNFKCN